MLLQADFVIVGTERTTHLQFVKMMAEGGSVFLDEIGDMPLNLQSKVLKTVESKKTRRIGGMKEINISARIIAATNVDLLTAVKKGQFREDLYYRLNVGHITVPPLRDRGDDVLLLTKYFIENYSRQKGQKIRDKILVVN